MALTNTLVANVCYSSVDSATDAFFSLMPVSFVTGSISYRESYIKDGLYWKQFKQVFDSSGTSSVVYLITRNPPVFPACDATQSYFDGMQIGWGVVSAMVAVSAIILIRRALFAS